MKIVREPYKFSNANARGLDVETIAWEIKFVDILQWLIDVANSKHLRNFQLRLEMVEEDAD